MTVTNIEKDLDDLTLTVTAEFEADADRVWRMWDDPRKLERWWGPPTYPATFLDHDLVPGGRVTYFMTGPEGDRIHGWWRVQLVKVPELLEFEDGFADEHGSPNPTMRVMTMRVTLVAQTGGTRMQIETRFSSPDEMQQILAMGMEDGMRAALSQIDELL